MGRTLASSPIETRSHETDMVRRLMWSGLLAGVGALASIVTHRLAEVIWVRVFKEDPPD